MKGEVIHWLILIIIAAGAAGGVYWQYQDTRPCVHPVTYAIGAVDARFDVTKATLITNAKKAAAIWNKAAGKEVVVYDPNADLKINLVYDEREANAKLGNAIAELQVSMDTMRTALDALQAEYTALQTAYNQKVDTVNARGGATKSEAAALMSEEASLKTLANTVNSKVASYNASIKALNVKVAEFNKSAGRTFEEGQYVRDSSGTRINIFQFVSTTQLERVLAHEFGHAIGLDHNDDPKAIMYAQNESGNLVPTSADLSALKSLCGA